MRDIMDRKGGTSLTELLTKVEITSAVMSQISDNRIQSAKPGKMWKE